MFRLLSQRMSPAAPASNFRMVQSYALRDLKAAVGPSDVLLARRMQRGFQYFAWIGMPPMQVAAALLKMPKEMRTVHVVFGREGVPMDIAIDVDAPVSSRTDAQIRAEQEALLARALAALDERVSSCGEALEARVVCRSPTLRKVSFHIHARLKGAVFADFRALHGFLAPLKDAVPEIDTQIYREAGSLRLFNNAKHDGTCALEVVPHACTAGTSITPEEAMLATLCVRHPAKDERVLSFDPPQRRSASAGASGASDASSSSTAAAEEIPKTAPEILAKAKALLETELPAKLAEEWRDWITVLLHTKRTAELLQRMRADLPANTDPDRELMVAFTVFSRRCPNKFPGNAAIQRKWAHTKTDDRDNFDVLRPVRCLVRLASSRP